MNNFEAFNALLSLVNTSEDGSIEEHLAWMVQNQESRGINKLTLHIMKLGDASVQVCPMAIPIAVDCSYVDKFNPFAVANHNDLSI